MSLSTKLLIAHCLTIISIFGFGTAAILFQQRYLIIPVFIIFIIFGLYGLSLKCPSCGLPVLVRRNPIVPRFKLWVWWMKDESINCSHRFK